MAIGNFSGQNTQSATCVAIGLEAGKTIQSANSVAIGAYAGQTNQGASSVAIGNLAGQIRQLSNSVAIGITAGYQDQGAECIAIGNRAGLVNQASNSIILNASGGTLDNTTVSGLFIKPVRSATNNNTVLYNSTSGELTYTANPTLTSIAGGLSLVSSTSAYPSLITKSITAGSGITITDTSNNLTIASDILDLNYINSFFIGIQFQHGSGSLTLMSNSLWTALGSTSSTFLPYAITNNYTRQLACGYWTFPTPGDGQVCGYSSTSVTGIQVSTGFSWGLYTALGVADTGTLLNSTSQNFWGLWNVASAVPLNNTTQLSTQRNMICFGSNMTDTNLCIYTGGGIINSKTS